MRTAFALCTAIGAALALPAPAFAQDVVTGSIRSDNGPVVLPHEGTFTGDAARAIGDRFATCIVKRHHRPVVNALSQERDSAEQYEAMHKLLDSECLTGSSLERQTSGYDTELTTNPVNFRNSLYKALIREEFSRHPAVFGPTPAIMPEAAGPLLKFAGCVVRRDPAASLQVALAVAGTSQEREAIGQLQPQFGLCLEQGLSLSFSKAGLVALISEAYYREAAAADSTGAN